MEAAGPLAFAASPKRLIDPLLNSAVYNGSRVFAEIGKTAVARLLAQGPAQALAASTIFDEAELQKLVDTFLAGVGTATLLGRARIRVQWVDALRRQGIDPMLTRIREDIAPQPPAKALDFFSRLVPTLGTDPQRFGDDLRRRAFTMAVASSKTVLETVQGAIRDRLATGNDVSGGPQAIRDILDAAGISVANPQYAEMVFRTNVLDAYNQGADDESRSPDIQETFPVWMYSNPDDSRSRPSHAAKDRKYWPSTVDFLDVRGRDIGEAANCRCTKIQVDKWEWDRLYKSGVRTEVPMVWPPAPVRTPAPIPPTPRQPEVVPPEIPPVVSPAPEPPSVPTPSAKPPKGKKPKDPAPIVYAPVVVSPTAVPKIAEIFGSTPPSLAPLFSGFGKGELKIQRHGEDAVQSLFQGKDGVFAMRSVSRKADGKIVMKNELFEIADKSPYKGRGYELFYEQVQAARSAGVSQFVTHAAGNIKSKDFNGYYTWARLGYDGVIAEWIFAKLPEAIRAKMGKSRSVLDLFTLPGGAEAWKQHGDSTDMTFNLTPGSRNMLALEAYYSHRKSQVKA